MKAFARLEQSWYAPGSADRLSYWLLGASWVYGAIFALRAGLYRSGLLPRTRLDATVIVVGNVMVGGTGKTPLVIALSQLLRDAGYRPGIISRGYRRQSRRVLEVLPSTAIADCGDEPALIRCAQPAPVFVAADRVQAARALLAAYPDTNVILSDDGLQHLALQRDIEICVFGARGIGNGRLLPAGPLRESWPRTCDFIVHHGDMDTGYAIGRSLSALVRHADARQSPLADLRHQGAIALAAIAQPEAFFRMLRDQGVVLSDAIALPDHDPLTRIDRRFNAGQILICTEKDAIKLWRTPLAQHCQIVAAVLDTTLPPALRTDLLKKLSSLNPPNSN